jgi:phosphatidate cytidylyltransferase
MARAAVDGADLLVSIASPAPASGALRARIISALVMAPVALGAVWLGGWAFNVLVLAGALVLTYEYDRLCEGTGFGAVARLHGSVVVLSLLFAIADMFASALVAVALGAMASFAFAELTGRRRRWPLLASPYICIPSIALVWLRDDTAIGRDMMFWLLAVIWATDIGAYAFGRTIGGPKLAPRFSPSKTWAGLFGGMVSAAAAGAAVASMLAIPNVALLIVLATVLAGWAQIGDITESAMKRHFGVKDSSAMIPGHGGFLDRLDGLLFAAPATALIVLMSSEWGLQWH